MAVSASNTYVVLFLLQMLPVIYGHGMMIEPAMRSSLWRFDYPGAEPNYNDNGLNCGGFTVNGLFYTCNKNDFMADKMSHERIFTANLCEDIIMPISLKKKLLCGRRRFLSKPHHRHFFYYTCTWIYMYIKFTVPK